MIWGQGVQFGTSLSNLNSAPHDRRCYPIFIYKATVSEDREKTTLDNSLPYASMMKSAGWIEFFVTLTDASATCLLCSQFLLFTLNKNGSIVGSQHRWDTPTACTPFNYHRTIFIIHGRHNSKSTAPVVRQVKKLWRITDPQITRNNKNC